MTIEIQKKDPGAIVPTFGSPGSNGADLFYAGYSSEVIEPGETKILDTGIAIDFPEGVFGFVTPRSGLAAKHGITVLNSPGLVDTDYRNSIGVILYNTSETPYTVFPNDRIAQLVFMRSTFAKVEFDVVSELSNTHRGTNGFGSTGR